MLGICKRYTPVKMSAEDLLHDGFIKIFKDIKSYSGKGSFEGWMKKVMINTVLLHIREVKKEAKLSIEEARFYEKTEDEAAPYSDAEIILESGFTEDELIGILKTLPFGYQQVMNLYIIDNYPHNEIAKMLGISTGTSKSQLNRGRKMMRRKLTEYALERENAKDINETNEK